MYYKLRFVLNKIRSPERIYGKKYNHLSDIWSFGLILLELATGEYPMPTNKN